MRPWSDYPTESFSIRVFLDTNILVFLIDNSFPSLSTFIKLASKSPLYHLVSSKFVLYEFVGVRKKEHYLRKIAADAKRSRKGEINFSTIIKAANVRGFDSRDVDFEPLIQKIRRDVNLEIKKIVTGYGEIFDYGSVYTEQLGSVFDLCLRSRLSNSDSYVLISAVGPSPGTNVPKIALLTDDQAFFKYADGVYGPNPLKKNKLCTPEMWSVTEASFLGPGTNLRRAISPRTLKSKFINGTISIIKEQNPGLFLGKTFKPTNLPPNLVSFKLEKGQKAPPNKYVSIIGKDLDFIFTSKTKIDNFWLNGAPITLTTRFPSNRKNNVSMRLRDIDSRGVEQDVDPAIMEILRGDGNYVFLHPENAR